MDKQNKLNLFWFRRDLRLHDNTALYHALENELPILCIFIFDKNILDELPEEDARVSFIHNEISKINEVLAEKGSGVVTKYGDPLQVWKDLIGKYDINSVFTNRDYEPYARKRDQEVNDLLRDHKISFHTYKDHIIHEPDEVLKDDGTPYKVFTPYSKRWLSLLSSKSFEPVPSAEHYTNFQALNDSELISLEEMGFKKSDLAIPDRSLDTVVLKNYGELRDFPARKGTSKLGIHYRFGTVSIREIALEAKDKSGTYLNELIWREFYQMILWHFPKVVDHNFKEKYDAVKWRNNQNDFDAWCNGKTGYPIVDAGMRELNHTGYMHNRVRMIVASFLTKHLLIDWRWGEAYFAKKLLDFELASNNGGWQWAAGTGTDAQPYFRIFNPESQTKKFDAALKYIKKWIPELEEDTYPKPIVDHKFARERALTAFKEALDQG